MQMGCFGANRCVGGEKGCRGIFGCLGSKRGALRCLREKGVFGGVKGYRRHNWVFGVQMSCWPWCQGGVWLVKGGVWGEKGCLVAKSGIWGRKRVFGIYIFFSTKVPGRDKACPACPGESI